MTSLNVLILIHFCVPTLSHRCSTPHVYIYIEKHMYIYIYIYSDSPSRPYHTSPFLTGWTAIYHPTYTKVHLPFGWEDIEEVDGEESQRRIAISSGNQ